LIHRRLQAALEQHGLRSIEAVGKSFDPYLHEAILFEEVPAQQDQTILAELQKGYKLYDRVLRPTLVKLGKATAVPLETTEQPGGTESPPHPPEEHTEPESA
jgi:molecular chaperone GrpE